MTRKSVAYVQMEFFDVTFYVLRLTSFLIVSSKRLNDKILNDISKTSSTYNSTYNLLAYYNKQYC